ncbi:MAG: hypothetical protein DRP67_00770 [Candidatus Omnitrophota bacterium]|nr:MAG: hypothetical protein DRP67_00770 [Candidatus Omnitrophota bacterium]
MDIFSGRKHKIAEMVERYLVKIEECMENFKESLSKYLEKGLSTEFDELIEKTHIAESLADDIRRDIERDLYEKSMIPESRGDILGLLESTDKVLSKAQSVLYQIQTEFIQIPEFLKEDLRKLMSVNIEAFRKVVEGIRKLFENLKEVRDITNEIDKCESSSDRLEREIIKKIFQSDINLGEKILLKEVIIETGSISDLSQAVGDRLNIIAAKRLI